MDTGDLNTNPFLNTDDYEYISKLQHIDTSLNKLITQTIAAQSGDPDLATRLTAILAAAVLKTGLVAELSAGGFKITGLGDATNATDAVNRQTAVAIAAGGGSPAEIPITELGIGSATALQLIRINAAGNMVEGYTFSDNWLPPVSTDFSIGKNEKRIVDITSNSVICEMPASPTVGNYYKFTVYGDDFYELTLDKNGNEFYSAGELIDPDGTGDLILNNGDSVEIVCFETNKFLVV